MKITQAERRSWSTRARQFAGELEGQFDLTAGEVVTLVEVCRGITRLDALHEALQDGSLTVEDRFGATVTHPLMVEARLTSATVAKLIGALRVPEIETDATTGEVTAGKRAVRRVHTRPGQYSPGLSVVPG
ncbi:hypothetical protein [Williamsia herbipolensis]|uniref:hypothetical protein n=1 Tax=Williamsia herbipolensis TaxID=1603258 RepID=UPI000AFA6E46|nr:hypothetical protein [Williamsia herbipolensis]